MRRGAVVLIGVLCLSACVDAGGSRSAARSPSPAACSAATSTAAPPPSTNADPDGARFVDATARSGLRTCQGARAVAPHCRFNPAALRRTFPGFDASGPTFSSQDACTPERQSGGVAVGDADGDGRPDLYFTRLDGPGQLFRNVGRGRFVDVTRASGLATWREPSNGAGWADLDNDGAEDLVVTPLAGHGLAYFHNDGHGHFDEQAAARGLALSADAPRAAESVNFGDYDGDGYLDVHVTEWRMFELGRGAPTLARLLHNRGARAPGSFEDVTERAGADLSLPGKPAWSFASAFTDLDGDGRPDLYVAGDFGTSRLLWNDGDGHFTDGTAAAGVGTEENAMGLTVADVDGDGRPDIFVSSIFDPLVRCEGSNCNHGGTGNRLFRNLGGRRFADVTGAAGVRDGGWGWGAAFVDTTNTGRLDLVQTSGVDLPAQRFPQFLAGPTYAWRNRGDGTFAPMDAGLDAAGPAKGLATLDADGDGRLDLVVVRDGRGPVLYLNRTPGDSAWLGVRLVGTRSNRDGLGAVVEVDADAGGPTRRVEYGSVSHLLGQSEATAHFGLGARQGRVALVRVHWPAGGTSELHDVRSGRVITIREPRA